MRDLEGRPIKEDFKFGAIKDFDDKELIGRSPFLGAAEIHDGGLQEHRTTID